MKLQPIDDFVKAGFQERMQQQFKRPMIYVTSPDKSRTVEHMLDGKRLEYPYLTALMQLSPNTESYNPNFISRKGLVALVDADGLTAHRVRILPTNFDVEITYYTNKFSGPEDDNVSFFIRRWLFARRNGSLSFTINYGRLKSGIQVTASDQVPFTPRDAPTEGISEYQVTTSATIHGYISEPVLGTVGIVNTVALLEAEGLSGGQFFPFERG